MGSFFLYVRALDVCSAHLRKLGEAAVSSVLFFFFHGRCARPIFVWFPLPRDQRFRVPLGRRSSSDSSTVALRDDISSEVDRILEKISAKGLDSLTNDEHLTMQKYAQRKR